MKHVMRTETEPISPSTKHGYKYESHKRHDMNILELKLKARCPRICKSSKTPPSATPNDRSSSLVDSSPQGDQTYGSILPQATTQQLDLIPEMAPIANVMIVLQTT